MTLPKMFFKSKILRFSDIKYNVMLRYSLLLKFLFLFVLHDNRQFQISDRAGFALFYLG